MAYNVNNPAYEANYKIGDILRTNRIHLALICNKNGITRYKDEHNPFHYTLKKDGEILGFIHVHPSNNLKFYAGKIGGGDLFHTFGEALANVIS